MKVTAITPLNQDTENPSWRVNLEGDNKPLWIFKNKPQFVAGYDIPDDKIRLSKNGNSYIWNFQARQAGTQAEPQTSKPAWKPQGKSPEEIRSIEGQVVVKSTVDIYNHCTDAGTPFDKDLLITIHKVVKSLLSNPLVEAIKKEGGVESA